MKKTTLLIVMDGYGLAPAYPGNAITNAHTPNLDYIFKHYPNTSLQASGKAVGLPEGQMGNSEVGHMNIGAGRIVWQELTKISNEIEDGAFFHNKTLCEAMLKAKESNSALHLMGLLSDGGVHSHITHLTALLDLAKEFGLKKVYVHAFLDGRDVPPSSAGKYIRQLEQHMDSCGVGQIASIAGRYYAMDRDNRWDRVERAYRCLTEGEGRQAASAELLLKQAYNAKETDEFVMPGIVTKDGKPVALIENKDTVIFFNFRPDRAREITRAFVDPDLNRFKRETFYKDFISENTFPLWEKTSFVMRKPKNTRMLLFSLTAVSKNQMKEKIAY